MFKISPIEMISAPNYWSVNKDKTWVIVSPNQQALWLLLNISDAMGDRPYTSAVNATLTVTFQRADAITRVFPSTQLTNIPQSVVKAATANAQNRSLWTIALTSQDVQTLTSGTVKFDLTENGNTTTWLENWMVKKMLTDPGH